MKLKFIIILNYLSIASLFAGDFHNELNHASKYGSPTSLQPVSSQEQTMQRSFNISTCDLLSEQNTHQAFTQRFIFTQKSDATPLQKKEAEKFVEWGTHLYNSGFIKHGLFYWNEAAKLHSADGYARVASLYIAGNSKFGIPSFPEWGIQVLCDLSILGHPLSTHTLAWLQFKGKFMEMDQTNALKAFHSLASKGYEPSINFLKKLENGQV